MQFKLSVVALALTSLAAATTPASQCNTGNLQCCQSTGTANTPSISTLLGILGIVVQGVDALIGVTCTPISVIGTGGNSCTAQPVCCTNNSFNGIIAVGCTPVNLNL